MSAASCSSDDADLDAAEAEDAPRAARGDWDRLVRLFADASPLNQSHWNTATGEVFYLGKSKDRQARAEAFQQRLFAEDDWIEVPYLESADGFALAQKFAQSLASGRGKTSVLQALAGPKPFRVLRTVLAGAPGLQRRYERMLKQEAELRLAEVCLGLNLTLADPRFQTAAERLLEAQEEDGGGEDGIALDRYEPLDLETPAAGQPVPIRRSITALSIGRHLDDEEP
jgi:hypothetical protein